MRLKEIVKRLTEAGHRQYGRGSIRGFHAWYVPEEDQVVLIHRSDTDSPAHWTRTSESGQDLFRRTVRAYAEALEGRYSVRLETVESTPFLIIEEKEGNRS